jgi:GNAT superfamily N-acetyltransferase
LFLEYLYWVNQKLDENYGIRFDVPSKVAQDMTELEMFLPPHGRLILATSGSEVVGIACLKKVREDIGEIKRMYVRPSHRGNGIGRGLL